MVEDGNQREGGLAWPIVKLVLMGLGGLVAIGMVVSLIKPLVVLGAIAGVGYISYRALAGSNKALQAQAQPRALTSGDPDFERRMAELERLERRYDAEIRKHS